MPRQKPTLAHELISFGIIVLFIVLVAIATCTAPWNPFTGFHP